MTATDKEELLTKFAHEVVKYRRGNRDYERRIRELEAQLAAASETDSNRMLRMIRGE